MTFGGSYISTVNDMLLQTYYLYKKSPKKCVELQEIVCELKECVGSSDLPDGGSKPLRACGTQSVAHKVNVLGRMIDRYGSTYFI